MAVLDAANPFLVLLSIIGLFMEYTPLRAFADIPNATISVIFVADFALRLMAYPFRDYFLKGFGWVDFLASVPGLLVLLSGTPLLNVIKVVRIGRFFRIVRALRFLRAFDFLKRMRGDSAWIQERVMQTGVSIVLTYVAGIMVLDLAILGRPGFPEGSADAIMLILLGTLLAVLVIIIFYMGYIFAKDMSVVQLIVDSIDADDYSLLKAEAAKLKDGFGSLSVEEGESEMVSLLKMAGKVAAAMDSSGLTSMGEELFPDGPGGDGDTGIQAGLAEISARLERIEAAIAPHSALEAKRAAAETIRLLTPAILKYLGRRG
jgi:hypothetical protein